MRLLLIWTTFLLGVALAQSGVNPDTGKKVYFLNDDSHNQWCGYASESRLKAQVQTLRAMVVGGVDYKNGRVSVVHVTEADETGDWAVNDEYTFDENEKIRNLKRTINIIPEDSSEEQLFVIESGKAIKRRSTHRALRTGKPIQAQNTPDWFEPPPVITELKAFPFATLISGRQQAVWSTGEVCIPGRAK
jgi:hypothetical protein